LKFLRGHLSHDIQLLGFIVSDWVGSEDNRRSASWICFSFIFTTIPWASRKHKSVAFNTTEAKYIVACDTCMEAVWLYKLVSGLSDQGLDSIVIYQSFVKLSENPVFHDRSKNIEIKYYFLRDKVETGKVGLHYISTDEKISYILVKPLSKMKSLCI
jgi:hypothetical protein